MRSLRWVLALGVHQRARLALAVFFGVLAAGSAVALAAVSAFLISRASEMPPVLFLIVPIVAVRMFGVARGVARYVERLVSHDAALRILSQLRVRTVVRLERLLPGDRRLGSGELLARFVDDVDGLADVWIRVALPYAAAAVVGLAASGLVGWLVPMAGVVLAASLVVTAVGAPLASLAVARRAEVRLAPLAGAYQDRVVDLLSGAAELTVYGRLDDRLRELETIDRRWARAEGRSASGEGVGAAVGSVAAGAAVLAGLLLGIEALRDGALAGVALAAVVLTPLAAHEVVAALVPAAGRLPRLATSARRVAEVLEQPDPIREPEQPETLPDGPYGIRIRGLTAGWSADAPVLRDLDLDIGAGERAVVVGPSGGGKSTLASVLLRFLEPDPGTDTVGLVGGDGREVDIRRLDGDKVRSVIGWCEQEAHIFDSTIAANVRLARSDADDEQVLDALDRAGLGGFVRGLPAGLDTLVGEHGRRLSGGQRQRIALARVLLAGRPVVIFDEPTEHLDEPMAVALMRDLLAASAAAGVTVLLITHRPELIAASGQRVDRVLELRNGRLQPIEPSAPA